MLGNSIRSFFGASNAGGGTNTANPPGPSADGTATRPLTAPSTRQLRTDPASRLPRPAAQKLEKLHQEQHSLAVLLRDLEERRHAAADAKIEAQRYLERVQQSRSATNRRPITSNVSTYAQHGRLGGTEGIPHYEPPTAAADERQMHEAEATLADATEALNNINRQIDDLQRKRNRLPDTLVRWLRELPAHAAITMHVADKKAKPPAADLESARNRLLELDAQISRIRAAPISNGEALNLMRQQIAAAAEKGRPNVLPLVEDGRPIVFPTKTDQFHVLSQAGAGAASLTTVDTFALFCWLHRDALEQELEIAIDELADDAALSASEKVEQEAACRAQMLELERFEEQCIVGLEVSGRAVARRENASPEAVLGVVVS